MYGPRETGIKRFADEYFETRGPAISAISRNGLPQLFDWGAKVKEPTEHLTMAKLLALLLERLPEGPAIKNDESKIRAALHVLMPEPKWRHECREDIEAALTLIEKNEFFR
jgi:hypothetical protein